MKKCIIAFILALVLLFTSTATAIGEDTSVQVINLNEVTEEQEVFDVEKLEYFYDIHLYEYTMEELEVLIAEQVEIKIKAHELAEAARALGWPEDSAPIIMAQTEHWNAKLALVVYQARYDELKNSKWNLKKAEYPVATEIWLYMKELGWNDYVCAGILGNIMAEVGGQTLNIKPLTKGKGYYGICQWSKTYKSVWDTDLESQLDFLRDTIKYEIDTYGYAISKGFNFNSFLELTSEKEVARVFAKCYERCSSKSFQQRQKNATTAYNYFVD